MSGFGSWLFFCFGIEAVAQREHPLVVTERAAAIDGEAALDEIAASQRPLQVAVQEA